MKKILGYLSIAASAYILATSVNFIPFEKSSVTTQLLICDDDAGDDDFGLSVPPSATPDFVTKSAFFYSIVEPNLPIVVNDERQFIKFCNLRI